MQEISHYKIADFTVAMNCTSNYMRRISQPYMSEEQTEAEIDLCYTQEERERNMKWSLPMFEYNLTLARFIAGILKREAFCFHASALSVDGEGILFSADSGTGKSTHARLWHEFLSKEHELISLNDDKPIIRIVDGKPWVYGSPWSGKHSIHENGHAPVKALVFLARGEENRMERLSREEVFDLLFAQTIGGKSGRHIAQLMELLEQFIQNISVYRLWCDMSEEAVRLVYNTVWEEKENED